MHITEQHDVWVQEANGDSSTSKVQEQYKTKDRFNTEPNGGDHNERLLEFKSTIQTKNVTDDTNNEGSHHGAKSFKTWSVHLWCKRDQTQTSKSKRDSIYNNRSSSGIATATTKELQKR